VASDPGLNYTSAKGFTKVEREVGEPKAMGKRTRSLDRASRTAAPLSVILFVAPQLKRYCDRRFNRALGNQLRCDGAIDAAAHRHQHAAWGLYKFGICRRRSAERPGQSVGCQLSGVQLASAEPAKLCVHVVSADPRRIDHRLPLRQFDNGARGGASRAATGGGESYLR
jgi:hypothetical protein